MRNKQLYPKEWNDTIRPAILKRDKYKCQRCGIKHRDIGYYDYKSVWVSCDNFMIEYAKKTGFKVKEIILQVHHKDGNRANNNETNLTSVCDRCHMIIEAAGNRVKRLIKNSNKNNK
jgi:5-methylcytosine-specific restriction endonuclease McrA